MFEVRDAQAMFTGFTAPFYAHRWTDSLACEGVLVKVSNPLVSPSRTLSRLLSLYAHTLEPVNEAPTDDSVET